MNKYRLINKKCSRCQNDFYTTHINGSISCPFCGYSFQSAELVRRGHIRETMEDECIISNGFGKISVHTVDVCEGGIGIKMAGKLPFNKDDNLNIIISALEMKNRAQVIWLRNSINDLSRAGLRFT